MKKYTATFMREFKIDIDAETIEIADALAKQIITQFPKVKLMSLFIEGYVEPVDPPPQLSPPRRPGNKPTGGGSPGTPVVNIGAPPVDQIAKVA
jgi:hypothetical protein